MFETCGKRWGDAAGLAFELYCCRGRMLTFLQITETNSCQSILPIGQTGSRGAEDGKRPSHRLRELQADVLSGEANRRRWRNSTADVGMNITIFVVWRSGVANTSPSVSIRGLSTEWAGPASK